MLNEIDDILYFVRFTIADDAVSVMCELDRLSIGSREAGEPCAMDGSVVKARLHISFVLTFQVSPVAPVGAPTHVPELRRGFAFREYRKLRYHKILFSVEVVFCNHFDGLGEEKE